MLPNSRLVTWLSGNEIAEAQTLVQLAHRNEAPIRGDQRSLEIDLQ
jgi:hypothetical protein